VIGNLGQNNLEETVKCFKLSADQGNAFGQSKYVPCFYNGEGVGQNLSEAAKDFKMSADKGNAIWPIQLWTLS
jgi:TPR repeat protein